MPVRSTILHRPREGEPPKRWLTCDPEIEPVGKRAPEFGRAPRELDPGALDRWLEVAEGSLLQRFAAVLRRDYSAVRAAASLPWSNGPVQRQVAGWLKLLKRRMDGRANFDPLRARRARRRITALVSPLTGSKMLVRSDVAGTPTDESQSAQAQAPRRDRSRHGVQPGSGDAPDPPRTACAWQS